MADSVPIRLALAQIDPTVGDVVGNARLISAAIEGQLDDVAYQTHDVFGLAMPVHCPGLSADILNPRSTWEDKDAYDHQANELAGSFLKNFAKFFFLSTLASNFSIAFFPLNSTVLV